MDLLLEALMNPGSMTRAQVLLLAIMLFIIIASVFFVWKLYRIVIMSRKSTYVPNIGLKRAGVHSARAGTHGVGGSAEGKIRHSDGQSEDGRGGANDHSKGMPSDKTDMQ